MQEVTISHFKFCSVIFQYHYQILQLFSNNGLLLIITGTILLYRWINKNDITSIFQINRYSRPNLSEQLIILKRKLFAYFFDTDMDERVVFSSNLVSDIPMYYIL